LASAKGINTNILATNLYKNSQRTGASKLGITHEVFRGAGEFDPLKAMSSAQGGLQRHAVRERRDSQRVDPTRSAVILFARSSERGSHAAERTPPDDAPLRGVFGVKVFLATPLRRCKGGQRSPMSQPC
jgi:hypothetical protein